MFTIQELNEYIDLNDFDVLDNSADSITLRSKNTDHCWRLLSRESNSSSSIIIYHTLYHDMEYLERCCAINLAQALRFIKHLDASMHRAHFS